MEGREGGRMKGNVRMMRTHDDQRGARVVVV